MTKVSMELIAFSPILFSSPVLTSAAPFTQPNRELEACVIGANALTTGSGFNTSFLKSDVFSLAELAAVVVTSVAASAAGWKFVARFEGIAGENLDSFSGCFGWTGTWLSTNVGSSAGGGTADRRLVPADDAGAAVVSEGDDILQQGYQNKR